MKKSFVLFIMILVLGAAAVCFGQNRILAEKDNVKITEHVLYGDNSVVEGVTLELHNHYQNQIFWDTAYVMGEEPKVETDYTFYQVKQSSFPIRWSGNIYFNNDADVFGWDEAEEIAPEGLEVAVYELIEDTGASETGTKTVLLKDYVDNYGFGVGFQAPYDKASGEKRLHYDLDARWLRVELYHAKESEGKNYGYSNDAIKQIEKEFAWLKAFQKFFEIPVLENEAYIISVKKDEHGDVVGHGYSSINVGGGSGDIDVPLFTEREKYDSFQFYTSYAVGDGDVYLTFNTHSEKGEVVDTSRIPGGYGIYHFPYDLEKEEIYPEKLQMVYSLDPNLDVQDLARDARGENLLLFTIEDGIEETDLYMSVIDIATMSLVDKFNISESREDVAGVDYLVLEEDYMVIMTYGDIIVFSIDENGTYKKEFEVANEVFRVLGLEEDEYYELLQNDTEYDWNGRQLIFTNNLYNVNGYMGTNFYVGVVDKNGLQYFATYDTSLQSPVSKDENGYDTYNYNHVRPNDFDAIEVKWE